MRPVMPIRVRLEKKYSRHMFFLRVWRAGWWCRRWRIPVIPALVRFLCRVIFQADIPTRVDIPREVVFMHNGLGVVVHTRVRFEGPAMIFHHVTLGNNQGLSDGEPFIRGRVMIGAGACVLGPVTIGPNAVVGANSVVTKDVPPNHVAIGSPMTIRPLSSEFLVHLFGEE